MLVVSLTNGQVQQCFDARGGVFDRAASETWHPLGSWQLGMNSTGMGGNGDYGLETLAFVNTVTRFSTAVEGALVAAINDTNYYQGYVGVGVTQGKFGTNLTNPFISQLAQTYGTIPSHGYGYTAGAYYRASESLSAPLPCIFPLLTQSQTVRVPALSPL